MVGKNPNCDPSPHGWTLDTLETYLSSKVEGVIRLANERETSSKERSDAAKEAVAAALAAVEKSNAASMAASEKAILKAELGQEKRNEASNEIRAAMMDQQKNFAAKSETDFRFAANIDALAALSKRIDNIDMALASSSGKSAGVGSVGTVVLGIVAVLGVAWGVVASFVSSFTP